LVKLSHNQNAPTRPEAKEEQLFLPKADSSSFQELWKEAIASADSCKNLKEQLSVLRESDGRHSVIKVELVEALTRSILTLRQCAALAPDLATRSTLNLAVGVLSKQCQVINGT
jgi:hypothetical protein